MRHCKPSLTLMSAVAGVLALGIGVQRANAQVDGFSGHAVTNASNFFMSTGSDTLVEPLATGGTYTLYLGKDLLGNVGTPTITIGGNTYNVDAVNGVYELFTSATPNSGNQPGSDPRNGLGGAANTSGAKYTAWSPDEVHNLGSGNTQAWGWVGSGFGGGGPASNNPTTALWKAGTSDKLYTGSLGTFSFKDETEWLAANPNQHVYFGFDVSLSTSTGFFPGSTGQTGKIYFQTDGGGFVPEPMFYQGAALLGMSGIGLFRMRRRRDTANA